MFWQSYKNTLKNLTRSPLFWAMVALVFFVLMYQVIVGYTGTLDLATGEMIVDTDPRYAMDEPTYHQLAGNVIGVHMMTYTMPCLVVICVMLILDRDYGDNFFEVERAGGVKPISYLMGRFAALGSVLIPIGAIASYLGFAYYYVTRGGLNGQGFGQMWGDITVRALRTYCFGSVPVVLFYLFLTYMAGSLLKSGLAGGMVGIGHLALMVIATQAAIRRFLPRIFDYLSTHGDTVGNPVMYWSFGDYQTYPFCSNAFVAIWTASMLGQATVCLIVSVLLIRKREI